MSEPCRCEFDRQHGDRDTGRSSQEPRPERDQGNVQTQTGYWSTQLEFQQQKSMTTTFLNIAGSSDEPQAGGGTEDGAVRVHKGHDRGGVGVPHRQGRHHGVPVRAPEIQKQGGR